MSGREGRGAVRAYHVGRAESMLQLGAHVVTPRAFYIHHGIYLGNGLVAHYRGFEHGLRIGPIETVSIEQFTRGHPLRVLLEATSRFSGAEIAQRALSRIGENRYRVLSNNCEHFCEWCVHAEQRSYQVDRLLRWIFWPLRLTRNVIARATRALGVPTTAVSCHSSDRGCNQ